MSQLVEITDFVNKYSDNLLSTDSLLKNNPTISFVGDGSYTIEQDEFFLDYSLHADSFVFDSGNVDSVDGTTVAFNFGDALKYHSYTEQNNLFQFSINPKLINLNTSITNAEVTIKVNVFSDAVLIDTFETIVDLKQLQKYTHYTFGFWYNVATESDVNFTFELSNDGFGVPLGRYIFAFSGFKAEVDNKFLGIPTPYSLPIPVQSTGWQSIVNTSTTQVITADTETQIIFTGTEEQNGDLVFLDNTGVITPIQEGDTLTVDVAFSFVVPSGSTNHYSVYFKIGGVIFRGISLPMIKGVGETEYFSQSYTLPVSASFIGNTAICYIDSNVGVTLSNRYISVLRSHKAKI